MCDHCFRHEVVGARLWSDGMFAECDLVVENDYHNNVHGKYIDTQLVWGEFIYPKIIIII